MKKKQHLSKTRVKQGLQCVKNLYLQVHKPKLAEPYTINERRLFEQGHKIGQKAREYFPKGYLVQAPYWDFKKAEFETQEALKNNPPYIYEGLFMHQSLVVRVDILKINPQDYEIIEVKSGTNMKEDHIQDIAIQYHTLHQLKYPIRKCSLLYINKKCAYPHLENLFIEKDVTERVLKTQDDISKNIQHFQSIIKQEEEPLVEIGPHCQKPYPCKFTSYCWKKIKKPSVFQIPSIGEKAWEFYQKNQVDLSEAPDDELLPRQCVYKKVHITGKNYINKEKIKEEISSWKFPLYFLDFETLAPPIPRFQKTQAFEQIPFQFSCFRQDSLEIMMDSQNKQSILFQNGDMNPKIEEHYLHTDTKDPRFALAQKLVQFIQASGSVVAYYKQFESIQLKNLAHLFSEFKDHLLNIESRLVDPLPILREHVCFKEFESSWSIKSVAPVLLGEKWDYSKLEVQEGLTAQIYFEKMSYLKADHPNKKKMIKDLINYCRQDTLCLALITLWLYQNSNP